MQNSRSKVLPHFRGKHSNCMAYFLHFFVNGWFNYANGTLIWYKNANNEDGLLSIYFK